MSSVAEKWLSPAEYLALERLAEYKSEYCNGQVFAMSGASRAHNLITGNLAGTVGNHLKGRPCEMYIADMRVKVAASGLYTYPDVAVACPPIQLEDEHSDTLLNPSVIIEVLSPSTEKYDRGEKFAHYRRLASLQEYVLVAQDRMRVEHYLRDGEHWILTELNQPETVLELPSIECQVPLRDIYDKVLP